jgi:hypothetical protein
MTYRIEFISSRHVCSDKFQLLARLIMPFGNLLVVPRTVTPQSGAGTHRSAQISSRRLKTTGRSPRISARKAAAVSESIEKRCDSVAAKDQDQAVRYYFSAHQRERLSEMYHQHHEQVQSFWGIHTLVESCGITISPDLLELCLTRVGVNPSTIEFISEDQFMLLVQQVMFGEQCGDLYFEADEQLLDLVYECELTSGDEEIALLAEQVGGRVFPHARMQELLHRFRLHENVFQQIATKQKVPRHASGSVAEGSESIHVKESKRPPPPPFVPLVTMEKLKKCLQSSNSEDAEDFATRKASFNPTAHLAQLLAQQHAHEPNTESFSFDGLGTPSIVVGNETVLGRQRVATPQQNVMTRIRMASTVTQSLQHLLDYSKNPNAAACLLSGSSSNRSSLSVERLRGALQRQQQQDDLMSVDRHTKPTSDGDSSEDGTTIAGVPTNISPALPPWQTPVKSMPADNPGSLHLAEVSDLVLGLSMQMIRELGAEDDADSRRRSVLQRESTLAFSPGVGMTSFMIKAESRSDAPVGPGTYSLPDLNIRDRKSYAKPWNEKPPVAAKKTQLSREELNSRSTMRMTTTKLMAELSNADTEILKTLSPSLKRCLPKQRCTQMSDDGRFHSPPPTSSSCSPSSGVSNKPARLAPLYSPSKIASDTESSSLMDRWLNTSSH